MSGKNSDIQDDSSIKDSIRTDEPQMYKVILHNDDYTTMEFVIEVLMTVFNKSVDEANEIMLNVHRKGKGICGIYTFDIAITKVISVKDMAFQNEFPLKCTMERD